MFDFVITPYLAVKGEGCINAETVMDDGLTLNIDIQGDEVNHKPHLDWRERKKQVKMLSPVSCLLPGFSSSQCLTPIYTFVGSRATSTKASEI